MVNFMYSGRKARTKMVDQQNRHGYHKNKFSPFFPANQLRIQLRPLRIHIRQVRQHNVTNCRQHKYHLDKNNKPHKKHFGSVHLVSGWVGWLGFFFVFFGFIIIYTFFLKKIIILPFSPTVGK